VNNFLTPIKSFLFRSKKTFSEIKDELEELLLVADVGVDATKKLLNELTHDKNVVDAESAYAALKKACLKIVKMDPRLRGDDNDGGMTKIKSPLPGGEGVKGEGENLNTPHPAPSPPRGEGNIQGSPLVYFFIGVNGVGKTTTIGKLGAQFVQKGKKVCCIAADTFRAASGEQLEIWAKRIGAELVSSKMGADPASVVYEGITQALTSQVDVVLIDTAGRLQTKTNLMQELSKMTRIAAKVLGRNADGIFLVLDATTGQNALSQVELFSQAAPISGLVLTKYDSTAKGGIILSLVAKTKLPLLYMGVGEKTEDLIPFNAERFVDELFNEGEM